MDQPHPYWCVQGKGMSCCKKRFTRPPLLTLAITSKFSLPTVVLTLALQPEATSLEHSGVSTELLLQWMVWWTIFSDYHISRPQTTLDKEILPKHWFSHRHSSNISNVHLLHLFYLRWNIYIYCIYVWQIGDRGHFLTWNRSATVSCPFSFLIVFNIGILGSSEIWDYLLDPVKRKDILDIAFYLCPLQHIKILSSWVHLELFRIHWTCALLWGSERAPNVLWILLISQCQTVESTVFDTTLTIREELYRFFYRTMS